MHQTTAIASATLGGRVVHGPTPHAGRDGAWYPSCVVAGGARVVRIPPGDNR